MASYNPFITWLPTGQCFCFEFFPKVPPNWSPTWFTTTHHAKPLLLASKNPELYGIYWTPTSVFRVAHINIGVFLAGADGATRSLDGLKSQSNRRESFGLHLSSFCLEKKCWTENLKRNFPNTFREARNIVPRVLSPKTRCRWRGKQSNPFRAPGSRWPIASRHREL